VPGADRTAVAPLHRYRAAPTRTCRATRTWRCGTCEVANSREGHGGCRRTSPAHCFLEEPSWVPGPVPWAGNAAGIGHSHLIIGTMASGRGLSLVASSSDTGPAVTNSANGPGHPWDHGSSFALSVAGAASQSDQPAGRVPGPRNRAVQMDWRPLFDRNPVRSRLSTGAKPRLAMSSRPSTTLSFVPRIRAARQDRRNRVAALGELRPGNQGWLSRPDPAREAARARIYCDHLPRWVGDNGFGRGPTAQTD